MTLMLNASALQAVLDMPSTVQAVDRIFADLARGTAAQPTPSAMGVPSADSSFIVMPSVAAEPALASVKLLADIPSNAQRGLPSQRSLIMLADHITGDPLAILDGKVPTRIRTAAATAVATKYLSCPDSAVLGLIGAGALAVAHVEAMLCVRRFEKIVVWSRTEQRVTEFAAAVAHHGLDVVPMATAKEVVAACDVLCTLTPSVDPIVQGEWFRPGQHINAVGARPRPTEREVDAEGMARARVFVDHWGTAQAKSGDYLLALAEGAITEQAIVGELGQVAAGEIVGRRDAREITLFNSVGIGALDLAIGRLAYDRALEQGLGQSVDLSL
ncbi:ornithine cyclodeaminase family protein [Glutamicibacter sp. PS]|uniref:ornithine cyclodeaminase family protein n=1 Tax=Glutamicibacter sp. PS TaxID=3075634 RepID=UPI00284BB158|nr:ornithine cyclodeaminase family protein [Glutamicibacter sp. PS]MDR4534491.1 ornithine cyclodeaminase family protein [Glutamicibacter sp. PS]